MCTHSGRVVLSSRALRTSLCNASTSNICLINHLSIIACPISNDGLTDRRREFSSWLTQFRRSVNRYNGNGNSSEPPTRSGKSKVGESTVCLQSDHEIQEVPVAILKSRGALDEEESKNSECNNVPAGIYIWFPQFHAEIRYKRSAEMIN